MAKLQTRSITKRTVDRLSVEDKDAVFWDRELPGFGVRVYPSGAKVFIVQCRGSGRSQRVTLGRYGLMTVESARRQAALTIARIKNGEDLEPEVEPATEAAPGETVAAAAERYLQEHVAIHCKATSAKMYRRLLDTFILPAIGDVPVREVTRENVAKLHLQLQDKPYQANRVLEIQSKIFNLAEVWGWRGEKGNPCRHVRKYRETKRERFLSDGEFRRLGEVVNQMEAKGSVSVYEAAAIRLLMLTGAGRTRSSLKWRDVDIDAGELRCRTDDRGTGCRKNEIVKLKWRDVDIDAGELRLPDGKTGARLVPLSPAAAEVLSGLPRKARRPWVILGARSGRHLGDLQPAWERVRERAGLEDVRIHDLRHSFASRALALGESLPMIGKLLGHTQVQTTARYAHLQRDSIKASASRIAGSIGADIRKREAEAPGR